MPSLAKILKQFVLKRQFFILKLCNQYPVSSEGVNCSSMKLKLTYLWTCHKLFQPAYYITSSCLLQIQVEQRKFVVPSHCAVHSTPCFTRPLLYVKRKLKACSFDLDFPVAPSPIAATLSTALFRTALGTWIVTSNAVLVEAITEILSVGNQQTFFVVKCFSTCPGKTKPKSISGWANLK